MTLPRTLTAATLGGLLSLTMAVPAFAKEVPCPPGVYASKCTSGAGASDNGAPPSKRIHVHRAGVNKGGRYDVQLVEKATNKKTKLGSFNADGDGVLDADVTVPGNQKLGQYTIAVISSADSAEAFVSDLDVTYALPFTATAGKNHTVNAEGLPAGRSVRIELVGPAGTTFLGTTTADADGRVVNYVAAFASNLKAGDYTVRFTSRILSTTVTATQAATLLDQNGQPAKKPTKKPVKHHSLKGSNAAFSSPTSTSPVSSGDLALAVLAGGGLLVAGGTSVVAGRRRRQDDAS